MDWSTITFPEMAVMVGLMGVNPYLQMSSLVLGSLNNIDYLIQDWRFWNESV
jgi:hypothetical protein